MSATVTVDRESLYKLLTSLSPVTSRSPKNPLAHLDIYKGRLMATGHDDDYRPTVTISKGIFVTGDDMSCAISLPKLRTFIAAIPQFEKVSMSLVGKHLKVTAGNNELKLSVFNGAIPTIFEPQSEEHAFTTDAETARALLQLWAVCKKNDQSSIPLEEGVFIEALPGGHVRTLATDRFTAGYVWRSGIETHVSEPLSVTAYALACEVASKNVYSNAGDVDFYISPRRLFVQQGTTTVYASSIPINYPKDQLVKGLSVEVNSGIRLDSGRLVKVVNAVSSLAGQGNNRVRFEVTFGLARITTSTESGDAVYELHGDSEGEDHEYILNGAYLNAAIALLERLGDDGYVEVGLYVSEETSWVFVHSTLAKNARFAIARMKN